MKYLKLFDSFDNDPRYKIGQDVVALSDSTQRSGYQIQPRVKGKVYRIESVLFCPGCGRQYLNFGFTSGEKSSKFGTCRCGTKTDSMGLIWSLSKHYAPIDDIDSEIEKSVDKEDYELAAILRDLKKVEELI